MPKIDYDDIVKIKADSKMKHSHCGRAWVVAILADRQQFPLSQLPPGTVYTIEFEDGSALDAHEDDLDPVDD